MGESQGWRGASHALPCSSVGNTAVAVATADSAPHLSLSLSLSNHPRELSHRSRIYSFHPSPRTSHKPHLGQSELHTPDLTLAAESVLAAELELPTVQKRQARRNDGKQEERHERERVRRGRAQNRSKEVERVPCERHRHRPLTSPTINYSLVEPLLLKRATGGLEDLAA